MNSSEIAPKEDDLFYQDLSANQTNSTDPPPFVESQLVPLDTFIGLVLAFSSCFLIGISVIYKKLALKDIEARGGTRAVDGGYGYLRIPKWWFGIILMALGEFSNFVAYIFAPAILVTPLGVFSIVCTAALSPYFLKERLNTIGKLGCVLVIVGCVLVTLCGPKDREVSDMEELQSQLMHTGFLIYVSIVIGTSFILMALVPKFGHKYVMLYITICSSFGSLSVMFCKGVGLAIKETISGRNEFTNWATWVCLVSLIVCLLIETVFMQRALDIFNSSVFMSINYVLFTTLVIVASSILYTELRELGWKNIILTFLGFVVNIVALYLLHLDKEVALPDVESPSNPEQDQDTPLMVRENTNEAKQPECSYLQATLRPNGHGSPLSSVKLTPSLLKGNQYLSFLNEEKKNPAESKSESGNSRRHSSSSSDGHSCSSEEKHYSLSDSNNSSLLCIDDGCQHDKSFQNRIRAEEAATNSYLREVPLIDELRNSSSRISGEVRRINQSNVFAAPFRENVEVDKGEKSLNASSRPISESVSETDEIAHLV